MEGFDIPAMENSDAFLGGSKDADHLVPDSMRNQRFFKREQSVRWRDDGEMSV